MSRMPRARKKRQKLGKKVKLRYERELAHFEKNKGEGTAPVRPKGHLSPCPSCGGSGLIPADSYPIADKENYSLCATCRASS